MRRAPRHFEGTAWYYARYRPAYPAEVIDFLVARFALGARTRVLDLGCGTGQVAIPLARRGVPVHAVDPEVEMLSEGLRAEQRAGVRGVTWARGCGATLSTLRLPDVHLCTMGASFHWMDRDEVLHTLDRMGVAGVALLDGGCSVWSGGDTGWEAVAKEVVVEFLGPERRAGPGTYSHPMERHEVVLRRSPFARAEKRTFTATSQRTIEELIGLQLSTSYASPAQLGDRVDDFQRVLGERLRPLAPTGSIPVAVKTEVWVAVR